MPVAAQHPHHPPLSKRKTGRLLPALSAWLTLFGFWLLLSGYYTAFLITAGAFCAAAVLWLGQRLAIIDGEGHPIHISLQAAFWYWPWLGKEIIKSGWTVSCIILHPRLPISPTVIRFAPSQRTNVGRVTHANSITLTPGTITVEAHADEFLVHALTREIALGADAGSDIDRRVTRLEGSR
jgi:multicomponent Na+:H+ antiporter subunit E